MTPPSRAECDADGSDHETEVDNTAAESHLRGEKKAQESRRQVQASDHGLAAPQPQHMRPHSSTTTPNHSFGQSMHALQLGENVDLDATTVEPQATVASRIDSRCSTILVVMQDTTISHSPNRALAHPVQLQCLDPDTTSRVPCSPHYITRKLRVRPFTAMLDMLTNTTCSGLYSSMACQA